MPSVTQMPDLFWASVAVNAAFDPNDRMPAGLPEKPPDGSRPGTASCDVPAVVPSDTHNVILELLLVALNTSLSPTVAMLWMDRP